MTYTKQQAITKIVSSAQLYKSELNNRNLLIIYGESVSPKVAQFYFAPYNFEHLTGVITNINGYNISSMFYNKALRRKLAHSDFEFKDDGTTERKLDVIEQAMQIAHNAKQIGDFDNSRPKLIADKATGTSKWTMAFVEDETDYLKPCSLLNEDVHDNIRSYCRVLAIFRKKRDVPTYSEITCVGKDIDMPRLAATIDKLYPELLARTLYGLEKNPNMKNPAADPYIAVEYKLSDGVCTKTAELYTGTKADCDRLIQSYSEDKPPPKIELYQLTDPGSEQSKQLIEAISSGTGAPTENMYTKTYEYSFFKSEDKDWCTKKLQEAYSRFTADLPNDFHGRKLGIGDVIVIDKHPFVLSGEKLKRVPTFFKAKVQEKSMDTAEKTTSDDKATDKAKHKPKKHKR